MSQPLEKSLWHEPAFRWLVWLGYVAAWTTALLVPIDDRTSWAIEELATGLRYLAGKLLHVGAYAVMTALTGWLLVTPRFRLMLLFFSMFHAAATELLQHLLATRSGSFSDVLLDHLGIAVGLLCTWKWWSNPA